jgi:arylsulfatase A
VAKYEKHQTIPGQAEYWANVGQVDRAVGELMDGLKKRKLDENTLVFFTSDNGPEDWMRYPGVWNAHGTPGQVDGVALRGMKLDVFEGGIRVCGIAHWPKGIAGGRVVKEPVGAVDLLPTLCEIGQATVPGEVSLDGTSFAQLLKTEVELARKTPLFWFYYNARGYAHFALRDGDYMMLARRTQQEYRAGTPYSAERFAALKESRTRSHQLYNLRQDPMEVVDLARKDPKLLGRMKARLDDLLKGMQEEMPSWE